MNISKGDIRRLARRGGVKRISSDLINPTRAGLMQFLKEILHDALIYRKYANR